MSPPVDLVQSDPKLPTHAAVVIIGGGMQSSRNWGWCNPRVQVHQRLILVHQ